MKAKGISMIGYVPTPQHDWDAINRARARYCRSCAYLDTLLGGCKFNLLASNNCPRYRFKEKIDTSQKEAQAQRIFNDSKVCLPPGSGGLGRG